MKMDVTPFFAFLFLLWFVASLGDAFMPVSNDADRNHLSMDNSFDLHDLVKVFDNKVSSSKGSPSEFSSSCLEIARKVKEALTDQSLINEIDNLASKLCHSVPSIRCGSKDAHLRANETCTMCRDALDTINDLLGDPDKELLLIVSLFKACEIQTNTNQCKKLVFAFGPLVLTGLQMIASKDICYMVRICGDARNQTQNASPLHIRNSESLFQSKLGELNLM